ncbi:preprotein translocase subunit SecE [bacterium (Candidatus Torokbacteria) CG_4_10_14_0_2_um_filter_35_8]|nr:MAG: preprotein translocase subunit SecE [bacterium (Candidatus Torokbacteria) CG_4_10_14_0_2_um_filter_35_8]
MDIFSKIFAFLKEAKIELSKVNWPTRKEAFKYSTIVIGVTIVSAIIIGGLDYGFSKLMEYIIEKSS